SAFSPMATAIRPADAVRNHGGVYLAHEGIPSGVLDPDLICYTNVEFGCGSEGWLPRAVHPKGASYGGASRRICSKLVEAADTPVRAPEGTALQAVPGREGRGQDRGPYY